MPTSFDWPTRGAEGGPRVNKMVCQDCGTVYYSAAAKTMVARGERCENCGGRLVVDEEPRPIRPPDWRRRGREPAGDGPHGGAA